MHFPPMQITSQWRKKRKENAIHILHMGIFAQTFSETIYKKVISGCLWKGDEGLGMRKRLHFIFITWSCGKFAQPASITISMKNKSFKNHHVLQENHPFLERKTHFQSPFADTVKQGLIIRPFHHPLARTAQVLTYIPSSLLTRPPRSGSGGLLGELGNFRKPMESQLGPQVPAVKGTLSSG